MSPFQNLTLFRDLSPFLCILFSLLSLVRGFGKVEKGVGGDWKNEEPMKWQKTAAEVGFEVSETPTVMV